MNTSSILAHRGMHHSTEDKNSFNALKRALERGFGIETDVRDLNGLLVISHDPPLFNQATLHLNKLLAYVKENKPPGRLALNIKSDGLCDKLIHEIESHFLGTGNMYAFDMSIPDTLPYIKSGFPFYTRISEYESPPTLLADSRGVWVDSFGESSLQVEQSKLLLEQGSRVTIVSSELHGREKKSLWKSIRTSRIHMNPLFELCTDFPVEAQSYFG